MALTPSTMLDLGTTAPDFTLADPGGKSFHLGSQQIDKGLLVIFMCNHCPYVIHIREKLVERIKEYQAQGITVVAINSNDYTKHPDDTHTVHYIQGWSSMMVMWEGLKRASALDGPSVKAAIETLKDFDTGGLERCSLG